MDCQAPLSSTISWSLLKFLFIELVMLSNHLILCTPFFCLQSFPASGSFLMSWLFAPCGQSIGASASASVLLNEYSGLIFFRMDWLISLQSKGLSAPQFNSINSLMLSLLYGTTPTSVHDYWKKHSSDYMDLCWHSDVSAF